MQIILQKSKFEMLLGNLQYLQLKNSTQTLRYENNNFLSSRDFYNA